MKLVGRQAECAMLDRLVEAVCAGPTRALMLCGEPGVGKTALLEHLIGRTAQCRLVQTAGVESEMELAFPGLHQLCASLLGGVEDLPERQADWLRVVFGMGSGWPDTVEGLARLRTKYVVAPLSNGHVALLIDMARAEGITFDAVFGADVFRQYKPHPKTYLGAASLLGCAPAEVLFVASHPSDLESAAACGLCTCFVSRPREYGAGVVVEQSPAEGEFDLIGRRSPGIGDCHGMRSVATYLTTIKGVRHG